MQDTGIFCVKESVYIVYYIILDILALVIRRLLNTNIMRHFLLYLYKYPIFVAGVR